MVVDFFFSSKPKQISESAKVIAKRIFGNINNLTFCSIGDDEIIDSITNLFKKNKLTIIQLKENNILNFENSFYRKKMDILFKTDILVISIDQKENLIKKKEIMNTLSKRKQKPILLINASIPGNIDMDVNNIDNCFLFDLNDLEQFFTDRREDLKNKNNSDIEIQDKIEYFITKFSKIYNLDFDQKYLLESKIKDYFYKKTSPNEKDLLLDFINNLSK